MRRPITNSGISATIGTTKLRHMLERRLEYERVALDVALDYGLDILAKQTTIFIVRLCRQIQEKGGDCARVLHG